MNINKIFNLFKSPEEPEEAIVQIDLSDSPIIWIGVFKKLIVNYETFAKQIIKFLGETSPDLDTDEIERASSYMVYSRAYDNLSKLRSIEPFKDSSLSHKSFLTSSPGDK